jgi:hypothetical protein
MCFTVQALRCIGLLALVALALSAPLDFDDDLLAEELLAIAELGEWGVKTSAFVPKATGARKVHRSADYGAPNGNGNGGNGNNGYGSAAPAAGSNGKFCQLPITIGLIFFIELCAHSTLLY